MATLLQVVQDFCKLKALPVPTTVIGSTDTQVIQLQSLLQAGLEDLAQRGAWQELTNEATWTTIANEDQGLLSSIATNGFDYFCPDTFWDRTDKIPLTGPLTNKEWQLLKALVVTGPRYSFRIRQGHLICLPAPTAGHTWAFEYVTENFLSMAAGGYGRRFVDDDDEILLSEKLVKADLHWRWKKEKGLSYAEDFNTAERLINNAIGRSGGKKTLYLGEQGATTRPGIFIPIGSWNL